MYKILWITNLSEIQNNSYCEIVGKLEKRGFTVRYLNRDNIYLLNEILSDYDCLVFGTNSLRDAVVRECVFETECNERIENYAKAGGGIILLHQYLADNTEVKLFRNNPDMNFTVKHVKNPKATEELIFNQGIFMNYQSFPNEIDAKKAHDDMANFSYCPGVNWFTYDCNPSFWSSILVNEHNDALIKISNSLPIVLAGMVLDWQNQYDILENIIVNLINRGTCVGILNATDINSLEYRHIITEFQEKNYYYSEYDIAKEKDINLLIRRLERGSHSIVLINCKRDAESEVISKVIRTCREREIQYLYISQNEKSIDQNELYFGDNRKINRDFFRKAEFDIQNKLKESLIDGSYNATIKALKILTRSSRANGKYTSDNLCLLDKYIENHLSSNGSYSDTFGATCVAVWYYRNINFSQEKVLKAQAWLNEHFNQDSSIRDTIEYYESCDKEEEAQKLLEQLSYQSDDYWNNLSIYDVSSIYECAAKRKNKSLMDVCLRVVTNKSGYAMDELIMVCTIIVDAYSTGSVERKFDNFLVEKISIIKAWMKSIETNENYLLKRLEISYLLSEYDELINYPVDSLLYFMDKTGRDHRESYMDDAIRIIERYRNEVYELKNRNESLLNKSNEYKNISRFTKIATYFAIYALFMAVIVVIYIITGGLFTKFLDECVLTYWAIYSAVAAGLFFATKFILTQINSKGFDDDNQIS